MYDVNAILARLQKGETPDNIANEFANAINAAVELDKKNKEAELQKAKAKEEAAIKEAKLNALANTILDSILEYVKVSAPEVAALLDEETALDASEVRKTLDSIIPIVAAAAQLSVVPVKKADKASSADDAIAAFLDAFIN